MVGQVERLLGVGIVGGAGGTLVESHHDVGADGTLNVYHLLGREEMLAAVDVGAKLAALLAQLAYAGEAEHLEAAAVGEHRAVEAVEPVEAAGLAEYLSAGAQIEMVGIAQDYLRLDIILKLADVYSLDGPHCAYGHEDGGLDGAVVGMDDSGASLGAALVGMLEAKGHSSFLLLW